MGAIDKLASWVSPRWAAQRAAWREVMNSYQGGIPTRTTELWQRSQGFRFGTTQDRQQVTNERDRAYQAFRNNPVARTLVNTETDNVIGDGLNYQPTTDSEDWNKEAKDKYYEWLQTATVRGQDFDSGCDIERLLWSTSRVAGDIGWILVARGSDSRIQIVPGENIVTPDGRYQDKTIYDGVKFDQFGAPVEYYVLSYDERAPTRNFTTVASRDFVFLNHNPLPNQARGLTCYSAIFELLAHLDRYVDGVSLAAWMATVMGIVFKQNNASKQLAQLPTLTNSQGNAQRAITFENGMVKYIGTDEEVAQVQAQQPMQQTPEFIRTMYRMLGQPFDMPLEVIAKDMSTCNFASARIGLLPFYRSCRIKAARFGNRWSRTIRWWLSREKQRANDDPKKWTSEWPENYWAHDLLVNAWDYTDPVSEAQSDLLQIDMGTKSPQMVIAERGRDAERIIREREEWAKKTKDLPLVNSTMTRHPQSGVGATGDPLGKDAVEPPGQAAPADQAQPTQDTTNANGND